MTPYKIFDNVLTKEQIKSIYDVFNSDKIDWHLTNQTVDKLTYENAKNESTREYINFSHMFNISSGEPISNFCQISDYVLKKFLEKSKYKLKKTYRVQANLMPRFESMQEDQYNTPHVDMLIPHTVLLYYVNDSDGNTRLFSKKINEDQSKNFDPMASIIPKSGRFLLFDGAYYHASSHPKLTEKRIVINYNLVFDNPEL